jgi:drug/metabolite transporter (DMT)-like permease
MKNLACEKLTFYTVLTGCPFFLLFLHGGMDLKLLTEPVAWLYMLGVVLIPTIAALAFMAVAIEKVGATPTAILGVLEPLTGLLVGILLYGEKLTFFSVSGIIMIFAAVLLVILADRKKLSKQNQS